MAPTRLENLQVINTRPSIFSKAGQICIAYSKLRSHSFSFPFGRTYSPSIGPKSGESSASSKSRQPASVCRGLVQLPSMTPRISPRRCACIEENWVEKDSVIAEGDNIIPVTFRIRTAWQFHHWLPGGKPTIGKVCRILEMQNAIC